MGNLQHRRRRVFRRSDAPDYDRSADSPRERPAGAVSSDAQRSAPVDDEQALDAGELRGEEFYREQMPPHHGS
ncbi:MAG: hypothetical protein L0L83_03675 [Corynebacterium flavescens]|nr:MULTISPECIES: hypothetical protein [Corynebacterium]KAA8723668.1 hypothetical protein F4V60_04090 [Corynebacterium flavescens]MDN6099335.1 hypothetical protein [Corynebacterium flavescens]MDN6198645.1 hypothetical protein [Corynebacterium flavescens]MDN6225371.1 hypothetical protein [Corynebacterium flavescens]MDN6236776.1 hypothetical protein [Corynebacterium flavescens]